MDGDAVNIQGSRNLGEGKVGPDGQLTETLSLWGRVTHQMGSNNNQNTPGMVGVQLRF